MSGTRARWALFASAVSIIAISFASRAEKQPDEEQQADETPMPAVAISTAEGAPIDLAEHLDVELYSISVTQRRGTRRYARQPDGASLHLWGYVTGDADEARILRVHDQWEYLEIAGPDGKSISFAAIPRSNPFTWLPWRARHGIAANYPAGRPGTALGGGVYLEDRAGPMIGRVRARGLVLIAERITTVDVPLPDKSYDASRDGKREGEAYADITLWEGTTLELKSYRNKPTIVLEYKLTTRDPGSFAPVQLSVEGDGRSPRVTPLAPVLLEGEDDEVPTSFYSMPFAAGAETKEGHYTSVRGAARRRSEKGPATMRFYLAHQTKLVPFTVTIENIDIGAIVNAGPPRTGDENGGNSE